MIEQYKIEICCGGINDVQTAIQFPIDRIELNSALELGGLTPSFALLKAVKKMTNLPICCMARCRTGGFHYSEAEFKIILEDAKILLDNGADGIVFGFLNRDHTIDITRTKMMVDLIHSYQKEAIFHKAFDETDMLNAIKDLITLKVDRILTSGGKNYPDITKGIPILKQLQQQYGSQIQILPGGGIRAHNVLTVLQQAGLQQVHMSASILQSDGTTEQTFNAVHREKLETILAQIKE